MDVAAVALARENHIPIVVFSIHEKGGFADILRGGAARRWSATADVEAVPAVDAARLEREKRDE